MYQYHHHSPPVLRPNIAYHISHLYYAGQPVPVFQGPDHICSATRLFGDQQPGRRPLLVH
ncbi:hypothetical protein BGW36DRAFT_376851 [Talaromyces proteolyticus]|uniref:Uncharacterized protein n=1 Tax=Talaromyces proteolyticus TaxID=1131652 RepID=A0AAD4KTC5_9EURO|nr:uncharacterized protein BGW36DRAFT_376851 [Talaromyces proteolyticus]KAH8698852.1 hypothetical protein BGW36DRAFT_376851 [Talaromyces proteolyticus]